MCGGGERREREREKGRKRGKSMDIDMSYGPCAVCVIKKLNVLRVFTEDEVQ